MSLKYDPIFGKYSSLFKNIGRKSNRTNIWEILEKILKCRFATTLWLGGRWISFYMIKKKTELLNLIYMLG